MADGLEIGPDKILFQDDYITVRIARFDTQSGQAEVLVDHQAGAPWGSLHLDTFRVGRQHANGLQRCES
jgi:hypothetical protein